MNQWRITFKSAIYSIPRRLVYHIDGIFETIMRLLWVLVWGIRFTITGNVSNVFTNTYNRIHRGKTIKKISLFNKQFLNFYLKNGEKGKNQCFYKKLFYNT